MFVTILPALLAVPSHTASHQALQQQLMRCVVLVQHQLAGGHHTCRAFLSAKVFPAVTAPAVSLTRALLPGELVIKTGLKLAKPPFFFSSSSLQCNLHKNFSDRGEEHLSVPSCHPLCLRDQGGGTCCFSLE